MLRKLQEMNRPLSGAKPIDFKKEDVCIVLMQQFAITTAKAKQPLLATLGAATCVIMALYNAQQQIALLAHVDGQTTLESLLKTISLMPKQGTIAHVYGGSEGCEEPCGSIITALEAEKIPIVNADILRPINSASLAIDARTGNIYSHVEREHLNVTPEFLKYANNRHIVWGKHSLKQILPEAKEKQKIHVLPLVSGLVSVRLC